MLNLVILGEIVQAYIYGDPPEKLGSLCPNFFQGHSSSSELTRINQLPVIF